MKALRKDTKGCVPAPRYPNKFSASGGVPKLTPFSPLVPLLGLRRLCVIAGDISPIDVITHVPMLCEEANVPYIYVHSKEELGAAGQTKRPTSCMLVLPDAQKGGEKMGSDDAEGVRGHVRQDRVQDQVPGLKTRSTPTTY